MIKDAITTILLFFIDSPFKYVILISLGISLGFFFDWLEVYVNNRP